MKTLARERDADEVRQRLTALRSDSARRWGRMSAHQMVCHLSDGYRVMIGERATSPVPSPLPRPLFRYLVLYVPIPWPAGAMTTPDLNQEIAGTKPVRFDADVADLTMLIERIARRDCTFDGQLHPLFGRMSAAAWLRWAYLHADHHLRQFGL